MTFQRTMLVPAENYSSLRLQSNNHTVAELMKPGFVNLKMLRPGHVRLHDKVEVFGSDGMTIGWVSSLTDTSIKIDYMMAAPAETPRRGRPPKDE